MKNKFRKNTLIIFLKHPEPGKVKTRLAEVIGGQRAAEIYSSMAERIVTQLSACPEYRTVLQYHPAEKENEIRDWLGTANSELRAQSGESLGDKLSNAFETVFSEDTERALVIGTDCIDIKVDHLKEAFSFLDDYDAVIGPARDGGYYLLGLRAYDSRIFGKIDWSTGLVLSQTIERLNSLSLSYIFLEELIDIDTASDLERFCHEIPDSGVRS